MQVCSSSLPVSFHSAHKKTQKRTAHKPLPTLLGNRRAQYNRRASETPRLPTDKPEARHYFRWGGKKIPPAG